MKFTDSKDGVKRCNARIKIRLNKKQWKTIEVGARMKGWTPHQLLETEAGLAVENLMTRIEDAVRAGKSDFC